MCSQKCLNLSKSKSFLNIYILMPTKENKTCSVFCDITRAYLLLSILRFAKSFWADPLFSSILQIHPLTISYIRYFSKQHDTIEKTESRLRKIAVLFTRCLGSRLEPKQSKFQSALFWAKLNYTPLSNQTFSKLQISTLLVNKVSLLSSYLAIQNQNILVFLWFETKGDFIHFSNSDLSLI